MSDMKSRKRAARSYRQSARAQASEETARRVVEAFAGFVADRWFKDITLEEVAQRAGVTVRTVIRRFGSKDGLLAAFMERVAPQVREQRATLPGDVEGAVDRVLAVYEEIGDNVIRTLAQEPLHPELGPLLKMGRTEHRDITAATFAKWLQPLSPNEKRCLLDALVIATDVYVWKLLRRDMGRTGAETRLVMLGLVNGVLTRGRAQGT
jgi:AcrR family transcriptional regulator